MVRLVRVSLSVLLRIKVDDRYVLFHSPSRPGSFGPPGGVTKYFPPAARILEKLGFQEERTNAQGRVMESDLRGFLPAGSVRDFMRWHRTGAYREDPAECLTRELLEELGEVGLEQLRPAVPRLTFEQARTVVEGPQPVAGKTYRQLRRFEVHNLVPTDSAALKLGRHLVEVGKDPEFPQVICADRADIEHGRHGSALINPQSAFLVGSRRILPDVPPMR
jgi:hypothetical protein